MAKRKASRPQQGSSALSFAQRENHFLQVPLLPSSSRELPTPPDPSLCPRLSLHPQWPHPATIPTIADVLKQQDQSIPHPPHVRSSDNSALESSTCSSCYGACSHWCDANAALDPHTLAASRLHAYHSWADVAVISDILQAFDLDEDSTSAYLFSMSDDNMLRLSGSDDAEFRVWTQGNYDGELSCAREETSLHSYTEKRDFDLDTEGRDLSSGLVSTIPGSCSSECGHCCDDIAHLDLHSPAVSRLHACHSWADIAVISNILQALDFDEDSTSAYLLFMSDDNMHKVSGSDDAESTVCTQGNYGGELSCAREETSLHSPAEQRESGLDAEVRHLSSVLVSTTCSSCYGECTHGCDATAPLDPHIQAVSRLHARHSWADITVISNILQALDLDEDSASAHLFAMSDDNNMRRISGSDHEECPVWTRGNYDSELSCAREETSLDSSVEQRDFGLDSEGRDSSSISVSMTCSSCYGECSHGCGATAPSDSHTQAISCLHARHSWADVTVISNILQALDFDEDSASAYLFSMSDDNVHRVSSSDDEEHPVWKRGNYDSELSYARDETSLHSSTEQTEFVLDAEGRDLSSVSVSTTCGSRYDECHHGCNGTAPSDSHALAISRLHARHDWAHITVISNILQALDHDEDSASAYLFSMLDDNMHRVSGSDDEERPAWTQSNHDSELSCEREETSFHSSAEQRELVLDAEGRDLSSVLVSTTCGRCYGECSHGRNAIMPLDSHTRAVSRLHACHSWADIAVISDILQALDLDEDSTSAYLFSMSNGNMHRISDSDKEVQPVWARGNSGCELLSAREETSIHSSAEQREFGLDAEVRDLSSVLKLVPSEPERKVNDIYHIARKDAFRMSRASCKHAHEAYKAFMDGDHRKAKLLSKQAREERVEAQRLHAEAAKQILQAHNGKTPRNLWRLDLHGLHVNEAVDALEQRLLEIESACSNPNRAQDVSTFQRSIEKGRPLHGLPFSQELKVITGVGNHSRGECSLPVAVQSFLTHNRYEFNNPKPGVVAVRPKFKG